VFVVKIKHEKVVVYMLTFTNMVVGQIKVVKDITETDVESVIVGGFEGGIGHWASLTRDEHWNDKPQDEPASTWATKLILEGKDVLLYETADDDSTTRKLNLSNLIKGIEINSRERPHDSDLEMGDAITYDCIIQYALFGELVYG
jgi:hypothetical protein